MFLKKKYIVMIGLLAISGSVLTWMFFYGDFSPNVPIRAKQVLYVNENPCI